MANRRPQNNGRRMDFGRNDRGKSFGRSGLSPWQGGGPGGGLPNLLPLAGGSTEATLALASNIINLLQPRQNPVPSLLDMPIRRDFVPNIGRFDRSFVPNRMGNQNFRRTGNYNRAGERINNTNRKPFKPNDGQRQNKSSPKKEADSKAKPVKESEQEVKKEGETSQTETKEVTTDDKDKERPKTRYDELNPQLLKCHICNKSMWDGRSFENHLSGRAHAIMMQKTAESYALTADTMRQEFKIREMRRTRKTGQQPARDFYCAMCDMYAADGALHRTTIGHRKLKKYLHPTCTNCHKEMPTRIELDEHRLTAEHLKNIQDKQDVVAKPKPEVMVICTLSMEQSYVRDDRVRRRRPADKPEPQPEDKEGQGDQQSQETVVKKEAGEGEAEAAAEGEATVKQEPEEKKPDYEDAENTILDYKEGDDLKDITQEQFPSYSTERGVGRSFLADFRCVQCNLCHKLLDTDETAEVHLKTWRHHQLFLRLIGDKSGLTQQQQKQQKNQDTQKRALNSEEIGNWKRRKTAPGDGQQPENGHDDEQNVKEELGEAEESQILAEGEGGDGDVDMPAADELEDWEQSVDEILHDEEQHDDEEKIDEEAPEKTEPQKEPTPPPKEPTPPPKAPTPPPAEKGRPSPRGTPRGRGRGRGRRY